MRRLYIGPSRNAAQMESVCGFRPGHDYACHVRLDSRRHASGHAPAIRRLIWPGLLYSSGPAAGHTCIPELFCLCLYGEVVWVGVRLELPFCPGHKVVAQPHYMLMVRARGPRRQIGVVVYASGNFWLGARGRIPLLPGHQSIYR